MELPAPLLAVLLLETRLSRKYSLLVTESLLGIVNLVIYCQTPGFTYLAGLVKCLGNLQFTLLYTYTAELFPTHQRATGLTLCCSLSSFATVIMPWITLYAGSLHNYLVYLIFSLLSILACFTTAFLP